MRALSHRSALAHVLLGALGTCTPCLERSAAASWPPPSADPPSGSSGAASRASAGHDEQSKHGEDVQAGADAPTPAMRSATPFEPPDPSLPAAQRASAWFMRGDVLRSEQDLAGAARAYDESYVAYPSSQALYNAALAYERAKLAPEAWMRWQAFASREDIDPQDREAAQARLAALSRVTSGLIVLLSTPSPRDPPLPPGPDGALEAAMTMKDQLFLDEVEIQADTTLRRRPGVAVLERRRGDTVIQSLEIELLAGETLTVDWRVLPGTTPEPEGPDADRPSDGVGSRDSAISAIQLRQRRLGNASIALASLAGASGLATLGLGLGTLKQRDLYQAGIQTEGCPGQAPCYPEDHERRFGTLRSATNAMIGVTTAVGLAAISTAIAWGSARNHRKRVGAARVLGVRLHGGAIHF